MTLLELRRYAIRNRIRIGFALAEAGECFVDEHGVLRIPSLRAVPEFHVETLLGSADQFTLSEPGESAARKRLTRVQLQALLGVSGPVQVSEE